MKRASIGAALIVALAAASQSWASGPIANYAIIDKVVLEPQKDKPDHVQIWGTFVMAQDARGSSYSEPVHGYLYYEANKNNVDICRREWADMEKVAGTGQVIGFADTYSFGNLGKVRKGNEKAEKPDRFPLGNGVSTIGDNTNFGPIQKLRQFPSPKEPNEGDLVPPGTINLTVRNIADKNHAKAAYVFTVESPSGDKEVSGEIKAGAKETTWTPKRPLKKGVKYTWSVQAVDGKWKGPVATTSFVTKG